jgi:glutaredoxin
MDIPEPQIGKITVYSKSGCTNCVTVKKLLKEKNIGFVVINCDEFILEDKEGFLEYIKQIARKEYRMFPMVFSDKIFIGGLKETESYFQKLEEENLSFNSEF